MDLDRDACYRALVTRDARFDGRLYVGVRTTGIYCRPVCPARTPKRENVEFHASAAAAQAAGFRPCLRCRPETAPELAAWRGSANTVSRALALIEGGAMDGHGVSALADRLGMGERQLRRLFHQHLGASPVEVAQTRRVHLAKQLIHETSLPMTEVALAAGYGSVRRFNETFQRLYGRAPATLRRHRAPKGEPHAVRLRLRYKPPYDWDSLLGFLSQRAIAGVERVEAGRYARTIAVDGAAGTLWVGPGGRDTLEVEIRFPKLTALPAILARVRRMFDLSADPVLIAEHLRADPALAPLVDARPGLRAPGAWDGFELAVRAILGQQITVTAAVKLASSLAAAHGAPLPERWQAEGLTVAFPEAAVLAQADLSILGMPGARIRALTSIAQAAAADPALFAGRGSLGAAVDRLRGLAGIGEWTAQYIAMRQMREPDAFPAADVGLMRALAGPDGVRPSPAELMARAEAWRPWRAYAALHLWTGEAASAVPERKAA